jgi:enoyl-CoA hydratase/carnithine racemase
LILDFKTILFKENEGIGLITLNRPHKLNAFNQQMLKDLLYVLDYIDSNDDIRAIVITASGKAFCAGADLSSGKDTFNSEFDNSSDYKQNFNRDSGGILALRMYKCLKPILVACNGVSVGVGATLQLAADIRIACSSSKFSFPFTKRGIAPDACSSWFLPRLVGISKSLEWCFSGEMIDADTALESGLISYIVDPDDLMDKTLSIARKIIKDSSPVSVALTRQMIWGLSQKESPEYAHIVDSKAIESRGKSKDAAEGVMSFLEKRDAVFENKVSQDMPDFFPFEKDRFEDQ